MDRLGVGTLSPFSDNKNNREFDKYRETPSGNTVVAVTGDADAPVPVYLTNSTQFTYTEAYDLALSIASGSEVTLVTYTVPPAKILYLERVTFNGTNIARYRLELDGSEFERAYTYFSGPLFGEFKFDSIDSGKICTAGQVITLKVIHQRPLAGDFTGRIQGGLADA